VLAGDGPLEPGVADGALAATDPGDLGVELVERDRPLAALASDVEGSRGILETRAGGAAP
jgi:hypothetical protein